MTDLVALFTDAIERAKREPQWFIREILNAEPDPWQVELVEAVHDIWRYDQNIPTVTNHEGRKHISIRSGHGTGKTYGLGLVMHFWGFTHYGLAVATAPKMDQLTKRLWPRYRDILRHSNPLYRQLIATTNTKIIIANDPDNGVTAETASDPDNLAGFHAEPQLFVVDEAGAQALDPMFPVIQGALSTEGSCCIEIGNPTRTEGEFFLHHNNQRFSKHYYLMHIKPEDSRFVSDEWVNGMQSKYGTASPIYQVRVAGNFATMASGVVFHYDHLSEIYGTERDPDGSVPELVISVDVADGGADKTVITVGLHYKSFKRLIKQLDYSFQPSVSPILAAEKAILIHDQYKEQLCNELKIDIDSRIVVDAIGVGAGTLGHLRINRPDIRLVAHKGGESGGSKYRNKRVKTYFGFADDLSQGRIVVDDGFVDDPDDWFEFCDDLMAITRPEKGTDKLNDLITKREYKIKKGKSPDRPDSVAMQYSEAHVDIERETEMVEEFITFDSIIPSDY